MMDFHLLYYVLILITLIYVVYNLDNVFEMSSGYKAPKMNIYDLDGYFVESVNLNHSYKPKIFVHLPLERNERLWDSFGSRSTEQMNLSIAYMSILSIIKHCGGKYDVILFDNSNIRDLLDTYHMLDDISDRDYKTLNDRDLRHWEDYCKCKIIYEFGGTMMRPYFYFNQCPDKSILQSNEFRVTHYVNEGLKHTNSQFIPLTQYFMVSGRRNSDLKLYLDYLEDDFRYPEHHDPDKYNRSYKDLHMLKAIDPKLFGIQNTKGLPVFYDDLLSSNKELYLSPSMVALFVNVDVHMKHRQNQWFLRMSPDQILASHTFIGQYAREHNVIEKDF
jgi:hypothetical protein